MRKVKQIKIEKKYEFEIINKPISENLDTIYKRKNMMLQTSKDMLNRSSSLRKNKQVIKEMEKIQIKKETQHHHERIVERYIC